MWKSIGLFFFFFSLIFIETENQKEMQIIDTLVDETLTPTAVEFISTFNSYSQSRRREVNAERAYKSESRAPKSRKSQSSLGSHSRITKTTEEKQQYFQELLEKRRQVN